MTFRSLCGLAKEWEIEDSFWLIKCLVVKSALYTQHSYSENLAVGRSACWSSEQRSFGISTHVV
jgi:hypothetical protein